MTRRNNPVAEINDKTVIEWLKRVAQVEPTADASARAIDRVRQAVLQEQPVRRRAFRTVTLLVTGCAAAVVVVLFSVRNHFQPGIVRPVANGPAISAPRDGNNRPAPTDLVARSDEPRPGEPVPGSLPLAPSGPAVRSNGPPLPGKPASAVIPGAKPRSQASDALPDNYLDLKEEDGDDELLAQIKRFPNTTWVNVGRSKVTAAGLAHLQILPRVTRLGVDSAQLTPEGIRHLKELPDLEYLEVRRGKDDTEARVIALPNLTSLVLSYTERLTDDGLAHLALMKNLRRLSLHNARRVGDAGLAHLAGLTELRELDLCSTAVTDAGLEHLEGMKHLELLNLAVTEIGDDGLKHVAGLSSLKELQLGGTRVTDAGLAHLSGLTEIWALGLQQLDVTDAGLEHLKPLTKLMRLGLSGTRVRDAAIQKFRRELPHKTPSTFGRN